MAAVGSIGAKLDLVIRQGADFRLRLTFRNADTTPLDLTNITPRAQLRDSYVSTTSTSFTFEIAPTPTDGWMDLILSNTATAALTCGPDEASNKSLKVWDLEFVDSAGVVTGMVYGDARVFREITKNG